MVSILQILIGFNLVLWTIGLLHLLFLFRTKKERPLSRTPKVSILKIFCGEEEGLGENLESFARIDYPDYEIILAVQNPTDPVIPLLRSFMEKHPVLPVKLVVNPAQLGFNLQVSNFYNAMEASTGSILIFSDSDTSATPDMIRELILPLENEKVGIVSALPLMVSAKGWWGHVKAVGYNLLVPGMDALFRHLVPIAIGPAMAVRRATLEKVGGLKAIANRLTTDIELAKLFHQGGYKAIVVPWLIRMRERDLPFSAHMGHLLRWMVAARVSSPAAYLFFVFSWQVLFAVSLLLVNPGWGSVALLGLVVCNRVLTPCLLYKVVFREALPTRYALSSLAMDLIFPFLWLIGCFTRTVQWRDQRLSVKGGELTKTEEKAVEREIPLYKSNKDESVRLFEHPLLERLTHVHPWTPFVIYTIPVVFFVVHGFRTYPLGLAIASFAAGLLFWALLEYSFHRFIFHYHPKSDHGRRAIFVIHGIHHDYPRDSTRLVLPLVITIPFALLFYFLFLLFFPESYQTLFAGFGVGYLVYDGMHFASHSVSMRGPLRAIQISHLRHHYENPRSGFGFSHSLFDYLFGTTFRKGAPERDRSWRAEGLADNPGLSSKEL